MKFSPPNNCPSCDSELVWRKDQLYCENSQCPAKQSKQVEHFVKTMKIKGLGPATIKKLNLTSISDIYINDLSEEKSEKIREKIRTEINKSLDAPFNRVLPAFGIPLIGQSATNKLSEVCESIFDINEESSRVAGLGPKATDNLMNWLTLNLDEVLELPLNFFFEEKTEQSEEKGVVCITGRLNSYKTKAEATKDLEKAGWKVVGSVTKAVTHLINESGKSTAKTEKAEASGIIIVSKVKDIL